MTIEQTTSKRWPIDYDTLCKGCVIPVVQIEKILGVKQGTSAYDFGLLKLKGQIEHELHARELLWTLTTEKGALKILMDSEATEYNHREQLRARKAQRRRFALMLAVDIENLTPEQLREHERSVEIDGRFITAQNEVSRNLKLTANARTTPGLPA